MTKKVYPAMLMQMGDWNYFSIAMRAKDVHDHFIFAKSFGEPTVLDDFMQRKHNEARSEGEMSEFLQKDDRFYGSIVIASLDEPPTWHGVLPSENLENELGIKVADPVIGYVTFSEKNRYYILDGQHRVASINHVIKKKMVKKSFEDEIISILLVCEKDGETEKQNKIRYRRLFTALNKNAKKTDAITNIIMDEDDLFAIVTRQLVENFSFFSPLGMSARDNQNIEINTSNIKPGKPHFTSLEALYKLNTVLINTEVFKTIAPIKKKDLQKRPPDSLINKVFLELLKIWESFEKTFPELADPKKRMKMRESNAPLSDKKLSDHALLRPIIQEDTLGLLILHVLEGIKKKDLEAKTDYVKEFKRLKAIDWDLRKPPFQHLVTIEKTDKSGNANFTIANESRSDRTEQLTTILLLMIAQTAPDKDTLDDLLASTRQFLSITDADAKKWTDKVRSLMPKN